MIQTTVTRNKIGLEDLLLGTSVQQQVRAGEEVDVTEINMASFPYDEDLTLAEKFAQVLAALAEIVVVDGGGTVLSGLITVSPSLLNLTGRLWIRSYNTDEWHLYFGNKLILKFNPTTGNLILPVADAYITADAALSTALTAAYIAADTALYNTINTALAGLVTSYTNLVNDRASVSQAGNLACSSNISYTINIANGIWRKLTFTSDCTLVLTFPAGQVRSMILELVNAGAHSITWPVGIRFADGEPPELTEVGTDHVVVYQDMNNVKYLSLLSSDIKVAT